MESFSLLLDIYDLETIDAHSVDKQWVFKKFDNVWHLRDTRYEHSNQWIEFDFENKTDEILRHEKTRVNPVVMVRVRRQISEVVKSIKFEQIKSHYRIKA